MVATIIVAMSVAVADIPRMISYQGHLTDELGEPLTGDYSMTFSIYDDAVEGNTLWSETQPSVSVTDGMFSVLLGAVQPTPDTVFRKADRWLGIAIGSDPEISPRTQLTSVPYAYRVSTVDAASGGTITDDLKVQGIVHASGLIKSGNSLILDGNNFQLYSELGHEMYFGYDPNDLSGTFDDIKIGVGTKTPSATFDIYGDIRINPKTPVTVGHVLTAADGAGLAAWRPPLAGTDNDWDLGQTNPLVLFTNDDWGIARYGAELHGTSDYTHINLGVLGVTGDPLCSPSARYATVGGGYADTASLDAATVSGGWGNRAWGTYTTVGGGYRNVAGRSPS
jgi:hypothetical protein